MRASEDPLIICPQVREMHTSLVQARKWAKSVRNCVSKLKTWSKKSDLEKVQMNHVNELLKFDTPPCNEPRHIQLKVGLFMYVISFQYSVH